jgi:hypothetical protein
MDIGKLLSCCFMVFNLPVPSVDPFYCFWTALSGPLYQVKQPSIHPPTKSSYISQSQFLSPSSEVALRGWTEFLIGDVTLFIREHSSVDGFIEKPWMRTLTMGSSALYKYIGVS